MISATHIPLYVRFYEFFSNTLTRLFFRKFEYVFLSEMPPQDAAVLLIGNHFSWWDGFWGQRITHEVLRRRYFVMMLESNLRQHLGLSKAGAFSIQPQSRSLIESLRYAASLLRNRENALLIFPTGKIESLYTPTFQFNSGLGKILAYHGDKPLHIVFYAARIDYEGHPRPLVRVYLHTHLNEKAVAAVESAYNDFYRETYTRQQAHVWASHTA